MNINGRHSWEDTDIPSVKYYDYWSNLGMNFSCFGCGGHLAVAGWKTYSPILVDQK